MYLSFRTTFRCLCPSAGAISQKKKLFNDLLGGLKDVSNQTKFLEAISDIIC